jgi:hypothetical protein
MDLSGLAELKRLLHEAKEFSTVWDYFLTNFGENPEFMVLGEPARSPLVEAVIPQVAQEVFRKKVPVGNLRLTRLSEQQFLHGAFTLDGKLATVIYFEDLGVGLLIIVLSFPGDTRLLRFTARPMTPGGDLSRH